MKRYAPSELARALGCHVRTIQRAILRGELKGHKTGKGTHYWHVLEEDVEPWLRLRKPHPCDGKRKATTLKGTEE